MNALISLKDAVKIANKRGVKIERVLTDDEKIIN